MQPTSNANLVQRRRLMSPALIYEIEYSSDDDDEVIAFIKPSEPCLLCISRLANTGVLPNCLSTGEDEPCNICQRRRSRCY
jgi:hypothetical protein